MKKQVTILIVEDDLVQAYGIKNMVEELGYTVAGIATSKEEAIEKVEQTRPDLVMMDIALRERLDGIDAAFQISSRFSIPIIYTTAYSDDETKEKAKAAGSVGYLIKPFFEYDLKKVIEDATKKIDTKDEKD
jgi:CheY-like chemotaxis protein